VLVEQAEKQNFGVFQDLTFLQDMQAIAGCRLTIQNYPDSKIFYFTSAPTFV